MPDSAAALPSEGDVVEFFHVLADTTRLTIVRSLVEGDLRVGELVERVALPQNAVSYHLKQLRGIGLLRDRRSSADGRDVYYSIDQERLRSLYRRAGAALRPPGVIARPDNVPAIRDGVPLRILFLCTHNSARSQFAEALARRFGGEAVAVASAGDTPTTLHPITADLLAEWDIDPTAYTSKSVDIFRDRTFDYVITVCDRVREHCPTFPGTPRHLHWSIPDPTQVAETDRSTAFRAVRHEVEVRVRHLLRVREDPDAA